MAELQEAIADKVKEPVENAFASIPKPAEEVVGRVPCVATFRAKGRFGTVKYDAVEHVILNQMSMALFGKNDE